MRYQEEIPADVPGGVRVGYTTRRLRQLTVSRRNLLTLLAKLDANATAGEPVSAVSIIDPDGQILLHAEEDAVHYDPERRAALGHQPHPGRVVRDAVTQEPINP